MSAIGEKCSVLLRHVIQAVPKPDGYVMKYEPVSVMHNLCRDENGIVAYIDVSLLHGPTWHGLGTVSVDGLNLGYESYYPTMNLDSSEGCYYRVNLCDPDFLNVLSGHIDDSIKSFFKVQKIRGTVFNDER